MARGNCWGHTSAISIWLSRVQRVQLAEFSLTRLA